MACDSSHNSPVIKYNFNIFYLKLQFNYIYLQIVYERTLEGSTTSVFTGNKERIIL